MIEDLTLDLVSISEDSPFDYLSSDEHIDDRSEFLTPCDKFKLKLDAVIYLNNNWASGQFIPMKIADSNYIKTFSFPSINTVFLQIPLAMTSVKALVKAVLPTNQATI